VKLADLVVYFLKGGTSEEFCRFHSLDNAEDDIAIYMEQPINIASALAFFNTAATGGELEYQLGGVTYKYLVEFEYVPAFVGEISENDRKAISGESIAKRIFEYAVNDA